MNSFLTTKSTRSRYIIAATIAGAVILIGSISAQVYVANTSTQSANNIKLRNEVIQSNNSIRSSLVKAEDALNLHLLSPSSQLIKKWDKNISEAITYVELLSRNKWIHDNNITTSIDDLSKNLILINKETEKLMKLRMNSFDQYPSFKYSQEYMLPASMEFFSRMDEAIESILEIEALKVKFSLHKDLMQLRHIWSRMILLYRLYTLNRIGSLNETGMKNQEKDINVYYKHITSTIQNLQNNKEVVHDNFELGYSLEEMLGAANLWYQHFTKVKMINHSDKWRTDIVLIKDNIKPLDEKIMKTLNWLEQHIENSASSDVSILSSMATNIINSLWLFTIIGLLLIVVGLIYFEFTILRPVAMVAKALKAEARGEQHYVLPEIKTEEAENLISAFSDMRTQISKRQKALEYQAMHDTLTGLPNRTLLHDRLQQSISNASRKNSTMSLLIMDLDHFKEINDTLGHHIGDEILVQIGTRLLSLLRESDTVARLGGDEFAILLPTSDKGAAIFIARKVLKKLSEVYTVQDHKLHIDASIGAVLYPDHGENPEILMQHADVAMYIAKRDKAGVSVYNPDLDTHTVGRLSLVTDLRNAIVDNSLELYYQPKLELESGKVYGAEALLRWNHPIRGFIPPEEIITAAEFSGVIKPLSNWVIKNALTQCAHWNKNGIDISISINLSVHNLQDKGLVKYIEKELTRLEINPEKVVFEITESAMMSDPDSALETLSALDGMGAWLSIDDYGTGFSSLAYIKKLPVDELKIDKSFVINMNTDDNDAVIVRSTIDLAHNLGLKVVAEGVEDKDTWDLLAILGCDSVQGYYMNKPLPPSGFEKWYEKHK